MTFRRGHDPMAGRRKTDVFELKTLPPNGVPFHFTTTETKAVIQP
jgi:hypothetical protein